jgi:hypothetical protein
MNVIEDIGVRQEGATTGLGTEVDRPSVVMNTGKINRVSIAENPPTEGDKVRIFLLLNRLVRHIFTVSVEPPQ